MKHLALINHRIAVILDAADKKMAEDKIRGSCLFVNNLVVYDELDTANNRTTCQIGEQIFRHETLSLDELLDWDERLYLAKKTAVEADQGYATAAERLQLARDAVRKARQEVREAREDQIAAHRQVEAWQKSLGYRPDPEEDTPAAGNLLNAEPTFNERDYYDEES